MDDRPSVHQFGLWVWILLGLIVVGEGLGFAGLSGPHTIIVMLVRGDLFLFAGLAGVFVSVIGTRPNRMVVASTLVLGALIGALLMVLHLSIGKGPNAWPVALGTGWGVAAILVLVWLRLRGSPPVQESAGRTLSVVVVLLGIIALSRTASDLMGLLHPRVMDGAFYLADAGLGFQPAFTLGRMFRALPPLADGAAVLYHALPLGFALWDAVESRRARNSRSDMVRGALLMGITGYLLGHALPVVGPAHAFPEAFPSDPPDVSKVPIHPVLLVPVDRHGTPSLHLAWALLLWWRARRHPGWMRAVAGVLLISSILAPLGAGLRYLVDLVVTVPFAVTIQAATRSCADEVARDRRWTMAVGGTLVGFWLWMLCSAEVPFPLPPVVTWTLTVLSVGLPLGLEARLDREISRVSPSHDAKAFSSSLWLGSPPMASQVAMVFFLSGLTGLAYEVLFAKMLALVFGSMATASITVLATYMGGLAAGSYGGGLLAQRRPDPLRVYALAEAGIGAWCACSPLLSDLIRHAYRSLAGDRDPGDPILVVFQIGLGACMLLPPTFLMGVTLPVLARHFDAPVRSGLGRVVSLLYAANTAGAATGAIATGYVLLPVFGLSRTTWIASVGNIVAALIAYRLFTCWRRTETGRPVPPTQSGALVVQAPPNTASTAEAVRAGRVAFGVLAVGGGVSLALEVVYTHLLAVVAGTSTYAFSLMLFAFLLGLASGAWMARRVLSRNLSTLLVLGLCELALAVSVLLGISLWDSIPDYFASFEQYPLARTFGKREVVRMVICLVALLPPATWIGAIFPVAMECVTSSAPGRRTRALGIATAINTIGNIAGALLGGFVLLPYLGSLRSLQTIGGTALGLSFVCLSALNGRRRLVGLTPVVAGAILYSSLPSSFDFTALSSGSNVYFVPNPSAVAVDHAESMDGGLTTVMESFDAQGRRVLTLRTNGKFQGDDSPQRELPAQYAFGLLPLRHSARRDTALVIGFGTGATARAIHDAGFRSLDVVDLSADVLRLASTYFAHINGGVLDRPGVRVHVTDGRNFLLLTHQSYDLVSIEVTSIWFAGAASLYNREFYEMVAAHLTPEGVFQQWLQLHRLTPEHLGSIIATLRSVFPEVWLYHEVSQGILVACSQACPPTEAVVSRMDSEPRLQEILRVLGATAATLGRALLLDPEGIDRFLASFGQPLEDLVSTDDNLFLEYATPRANVRPYETLWQNVEMLAGFRVPDPRIPDPPRQMPVEPVPPATSLP